MKKLFSISMMILCFWVYSQSPERTILLNSAFNEKTTYEALDALIVSDAKRIDVERKFQGYDVYMYAPVFEGAVGWGSDWTFPISYEVYIVTNNNDTGVGSFRDAIESTITADARIVVFNGFSGILIPDSQITFNQSTKSIYIAGQTSENGFILRGDVNYYTALLQVNNANGFIMRGLTFAVGGHASTCCGDNFNMAFSTNAIIDRNTFVWSVDESVGASNNTNVTWSNNLFGESLSNSFHTEGEHSKAVLVSNDADKMSFYRNAFALNNDRNPLWGGASPGPPLDELEYVQNVIYGWGNFGFKADSGNTLSLNVMNNVAIRTAWTSSDRYSFSFGSEATVYGPNNYDDLYRTNPADPDVNALGCSGCTTSASDPFDGTYTTTAFDYPLKNESELTRAQVIDTVSTYAGDVNDAGGITSRIRGYVSAETGGGIIDDETDVGGYPTITAGTIITDSDSDGIPDSEEATWGSDTFGYVNSLISGASPSEPTEKIIRARGGFVKTSSGWIRIENE